MDRHHRRYTQTQMPGKIDRSTAIMSNLGSGQSAPQ